MRRMIHSCSILVLGALVLPSFQTPLWSQPREVHGPSVQSYEIGQTGEVPSQLGVEVRITPEVSPLRGIAGFLVQLIYRDPTHPVSENVSFLKPTFFPASCESSLRSRSYAPYTWWNSRGTGFAVTLQQGCKETSLKVPVPYLEARVWCSNQAREERYLDVVTSKRVFDILAAGFQQKVENDVGRLLDLGKQTYEVVSDILLVLDLVAVSHGTLTAGRFVVRVITGQGEGALIDAGIEYLKTEYGMKVEFKLTGWNITCRLCGQRFYRESLTNGELLKCPRSGCNGEAYIHFK